MVGLKLKGAALLVVLHVGAALAAQPLADRPPLALILDQPDLPKLGAPSSPGAVAAILQAAGWETKRVSADELAEMKEPAERAPDLIALPTGPVFPVEAREVLLAHLQRGGHLLTSGGYAFNHLTRRVDGVWVPEEAHLAKLREEATTAARSLLVGGDFEGDDEPPVGGFSLDGRLRVSGPNCRRTTEKREGVHALLCETPPEGPNDNAHGWADLPATPGRTYEASVQARSEAVAGRGIAFAAVYQYDADGKLVEFRDFVALRGTTPWRRYSFTFSPRREVARIHVSFGFYLAGGRVWFDDFRLNDVTGLEFRPMNTATGTPGDGLETAPLALGMFDADYPLQRVAGARSAADQFIVPKDLVIAEPLTGWAASGVLGADRARWVPLLEAHDRLGRSRGPLAATLLHSRGPFAGSCWLYFGADNTDLFAEPDGAGARALKEAARFLARGCWIDALTTEHRLLRENEPIRVSATVNHRGSRPWTGRLTFSIVADDPSSAADAPVQREITIEPGRSATIEVEFPPRPAGSGLWRLAARLLEGDEPIDELLTGVVREHPAAVASAPPLRFRDNYFRLGGRPLFLFGSDTYGVVYSAPDANPTTWASELTTARDLGVQIYEILQPSPPNQQLPESGWRDVTALNQLAQQHRMIFMPGMLIGHNVAIGDERLERESRLVGEYAQRLGSSPALLWYINGDYALDAARTAAEVRPVWNRWIQNAYPTETAWRSAWGEAADGSAWGDLDYPPPDTGRWDDPAAVDRARFEEHLTLHWNKAHAAAIRERDHDHPITSEYYSVPIGGIDLPRTIGPQDVANTGFFGPPGEDLKSLPLRLAFNDLRLRGKGVSLGEYGVKTHPAWSVDNGGSGYHIVRSPEEQRRLFLAVGHYALGLGACKVQNWCLRDDSTRVFPWGLFYPNGLVPRDVAFAHRNQSLLWRFLEPIHRPAPVAAATAGGLRRGNDPELGLTVADGVFGDLLALHQPFNAIDDDHLDALALETRALILPSPLTMTDQAFTTLRDWVSRGGAAIVTGDIARDLHRRPTRADRLVELAGAERLEELYPPHNRAVGRAVEVDLSPLGLGRAELRPSLKVRLREGDALGSTPDGDPVLIRRRLGRGLVYFLTDPIEQSRSDEDAITRRRLYAAILADIGKQTGRPIDPLTIEPNDPLIHLMRQPTARGAVWVIANNRPPGAATDVTLGPEALGLTLRTADGWPAMAHATDDGRLLTVSAAGMVRVGDDRPLMDGRGLQALLSLDRRDLRQSEALLAAPFEPGELVLPSRSGPWSRLVGEFRDGRWITLETLPPSDGPIRATFDADRATCLLLICRPGAEDRWTRVLEGALTHAERLPGD